MTATNLPLIISCSGAGISNPAFAQPNDPTLIVWLGTQDGKTYRLPLSGPAISQLWEVVSNWRQVRDFLSETKPPEPDKLQ
jgi:hypothetical protein